MRYAALLFGLQLMMACDADPQTQPVANAAALKEDLMDANRIMSHSERDDIARYIARKQWQMDSTGTGLRYSVYQNGMGPKVETGNTVTLDFEISLITGSVCYTSAKMGPKRFTVGKGGVESGIEEAVLLLHQGDRAKLILPSHLAHGLPGDGSCIPRRAVVIYDVTLTSVN